MELSGTYRYPVDGRHKLITGVITPISGVINVRHKLVTGVITPVSGVITLLLSVINGRHKLETGVITTTPMSAVMRPLHITGVLGPPPWYDPTGYQKTLRHNNVMAEILTSDPKIYHDLKDWCFFQKHGRLIHGVRYILYIYISYPV